MDELDHWSLYRKRAAQLRIDATHHSLLAIRYLLFETAKHYERLALRVEALEGIKRCDRRTAVIIPFIPRERGRPHDVSEGPEKLIEDR